MGDGSWVALDVHARSVAACVLDGVTGELRSRRVPPEAERIVDWLLTLERPVRVAYEAGPTGYGLARACETAGIACVVAAPSRIARASGDRVKTDRRDAERLVRLLRVGDLHVVRVPTLVEEAARDLVRARDDARGDLMRTRHRVSKLLLRRGLVWDGGKAWSAAHDAWLRRQRFDEHALQLAYDEAYGAMLQTKARRDALDRAIIEIAREEPFAATVGRLCCLRGVSVLTALGLCVEIGDWQRFNGRSIGAFLGLVVSEQSSGSRRRQGAITKTGNQHARRLLVEAAWHHRRPLRQSQALLARRAGQPAAVCARADVAARRLHRRWQRLESERGKRSTVVAVAVARELAGWCWSLAVME